MTAPFRDDADSREARIRALEASNLRLTQERDSLKKKVEQRCVFDDINRRVT